MEYTALSPWAQTVNTAYTAISPRLDTLEGKTIGMFASFKQYSVGILEELAKALAERYPTAKFKFLQYDQETREVKDNPAFAATLRSWLEDVDAVVTAYGDFGSCTLFLAYDAAYIERLGKPCVMLVRPDLTTVAERGARVRTKPGTRYVTCGVIDIPGFPLLTPELTAQWITPHIPPVVDPVIRALTAPLSDEEAHPAQPDTHYAHLTVTGSAEDIRMQFYRYGWTEGLPIVPPTREAVDEMLTGTDLPPDHVVAVLPPLMGQATVEKIAINAVMAGCTPLQLPVLLAAVKGMADPCLALEGWTCSMSSWGPVIAVSGPAARQAGLNCGGNFLSPYYLANAAIAKAFAYVVMNCCGVRPQIEDMSEMGHENRFGLCIADNDIHNPWPPMHTDYGFDPEESVVTLFYPQEHHQLVGGTDVPGVLDAMCTVTAQGWEPGCMFIMSPGMATMMAEAGWDRQRILNYVAEYNRIPASKVPVSWLIANSHPPKTVDIPRCDSHSTRLFWSDEHLSLVVGGSNFGKSLMGLTGGGDHGGPSRTRIELPKNWDALVEKYGGIRPEYIPY